MTSVVIAFALAIAYAVGFLALFGRYLRRPLSVAGDDYVREPPDESPPAVVATLFTNFPLGEALAATLLDLVRRGILSIDSSGDRAAGFPQDGDDRILRLDRARCGELRPFEWHLVWLLFDAANGGADEVSIHTLRRWFADDARAGPEFEAWWATVQEASWRAGLLRLGYRHAVAWALVYELAGLACPFILAGVLQLTVAVLPLFVVAMLLEVPRRKLTPLTEEGIALQAAYKRFANFLGDVGTFDEKTAESVAIWDGYLPLALTLGLAPQAFRDLCVTPAIYNGRGGRRVEADAKRQIEPAMVSRWIEDLKGSPW